MTYVCTHCDKNDAGVQCPDCEGTGLISYCALCEIAIAGDIQVLCSECKQEDQDRMESEEFVEWLTDPDSNVTGLCDRIRENKPAQLQMAK